MKNYILDLNGEPVHEPDIMAFARWYEASSEQRIVAQTEVGAMLVSTVFLGLDHNFAGGPDPVLWETMIFETGALDYEERYTSHADALAGHERAVKYAEEILKQTPDAATDPSQSSSNSEAQPS